MNVRKRAFGFCDVNERIKQLCSPCERNRKSKAEQHNILYRNYLEHQYMCKKAGREGLLWMPWIPWSWKHFRLRDWFLKKGWGTDKCVEWSILDSASAVSEGRVLNAVPSCWSSFHSENQDLFADLAWKQIYGYLAASFVKMYIRPTKSSMQSVPDRYFVYFWILACV